MGYFLYIVECADGSYYTGIATDLVRRMREHNGEIGRGARYTAARRPVRLIYQTPFPSRSDALKAEVRIKRLSRQQKQRMIETGPDAAPRPLRSPAIPTAPSARHAPTGRARSCPSTTPRDR